MAREVANSPKPNFDYKKATQALNLFASKEGGTINKMKALKLLFFADRYHLRKYGRLVANNTYVAMAHGPVASGARDIIEQSAFIGEIEKNYANKYLVAKKPHDMRSKKSLDAGVFSNSDIEALSYAWDNFGYLNQFELTFLTHFYPEWAKHEQELQRNPRTSIKMDVIDFFDDDPRIDNCFTITDQDRNIKREQFEMTAYLESLWV